MKNLAENLISVAAVLAPLDPGEDSPVKMTHLRRILKIVIL